MKSYLILINWMLSFIGLSINTEHSPLWASIAGIAWFVISSMILSKADKNGTMDQVKKKFKIEEL